MFGGTSSGKEFQVTTRWADDPVIKAAFGRRRLTNQRADN